MMKTTTLVLAAALACAGISANAYPTGSISAQTLQESEINSTTLGLLKKHVKYAESIYHDYSASIPGAGYFHSGAGNEDGIRTTANYAYLYALLLTRTTDASFNGIPRATVEAHLVANLKYLVNTHKSSGGFNTTSGAKWGKVWESSLWSSYAALGGWMVWAQLDSDTQNKLNLLVSGEADFKAATLPPYAEWSDTKAEENGWDTNILSLARSMQPNHANAAKWDDMAKSYMMNTYSTLADMSDSTVVSGKAVSTWVRGANLHPDLTAENHDIFHPIYQMVPINELGTSAVFYKMGNLTPPAAVEHNMLNVWNKVLKKIALPEGEWIYPNGVDWMVHDYEHLPAYSFLATYFKDADATMLESRTLEYMRERSNLQTDGSYFGSLSDIGPRRESVAAQRLADAFLYHEFFGPGSTTPSTPGSFVTAQSGVTDFSSTNVLLHRNAQKYSSFSWQSKFMGYIGANPASYMNEPYVLVPYQKSFVGYYNLNGVATNVSHITHTKQTAANWFTTSGVLSENAGKLTRYLSFTSLPDNGLVVYMDKVVANAAVTIVQEYGGAFDFERDAASGAARSVYSASGTTAMPTQFTAYSGDWMNVDGKLGVVVKGGKGFNFGSKGIQAGATSSRMYGSYFTGSKAAAANEIISDKVVVAAVNQTATQTAQLSANLLRPTVGFGWSASIVQDERNYRFLVASNFDGSGATSIQLTSNEGAPVLPVTSQVTGSTGVATLTQDVQKSLLHTLRAYASVVGAGTVQTVTGGLSNTCVLTNSGSTAVSTKVTILGSGGTFVSGTTTVQPGKRVSASELNGSIVFKVL